MSALFACTRCAKRYPFEELSDIEQLCKECRSNFPTVKCTYCRSEFQQNDKNGVSAICQKCAHNVKAHGKPRACEYCNIIAAFIGSRCQRCANSEKRWGPPKSCHQCKQQCAFDRGSDSAKRNHGKLLCWLCTMAYKRAFAKSQKAREFKKSVADQTRTSGSAGVKDSSKSAAMADDDAPYSPGSGYPGTGTESREHTPYSPAGNLAIILGGDDRDSAQGTPSNVTPSGSSQSTSRALDSKDFRSSLKHKQDSTADRLSDAKKLKLDKPSSNGFSSLAKSHSVSDFGSSSESMVMITQLREQLESMKRQLQDRDKQLLDRDRKMTELRAQLAAQESKYRKKVESAQQQQQEIVANLQAKNREYMQQIAKLNKAAKKS